MPQSSKMLSTPAVFVDLVLHVFALAMKLLNFFRIVWRLPVSQFILPPYKVSPRVTEGWLNDTEMLIEASKMHPTAG